MTTPRAALPAGHPTDEQVALFTHLRRQEVLAEARETLGDRAAGLSDEEVVRVFYANLRQRANANPATFYPGEVVIPLSRTRCIPIAS